MAPADIQAAIDRAEAQRREMAQAKPEATAKMLAHLPKAAAEFRRQIKLGLSGEPRAALKARVILRRLIGPITVSTDEAGAVWADYKLNPRAFLQAHGTDGGGGGN
jgi:hypothetical protein